MSLQILNHIDIHKSNSVFFCRTPKKLRELLLNAIGVLAVETALDQAWVDCINDDVL